MISVGNPQEIGVYKTFLGKNPCCEAPHTVLEGSSHEVVCKILVKRTLRSQHTLQKMGHDWKTSVISNAEDDRDHETDVALLRNSCDLLGNKTLAGDPCVEEYLHVPVKNKI